MSKQKYKYHYFYKITNNINGYFYYGVHNTNNIDDGYMGSGTRLRFAYKIYGIENFTKEILKFFDTMEDAFLYESNIVTDKLVKQEDCYNCQLGGQFFNTRGLATVMDKDGNCFDVSIDDPRYLSGELVGITKGKTTARDKNGKYLKVSVNDPRLITGELVATTKGMIVVKDTEGNIFQTCINDPRYLSGELTGATKGRLLVKDNKGNSFLVSKDDPRYLSGELQPMWKNRKHKEETKAKMSAIKKMTKSQAGEKNSQYGTCWIYNEKESIKVKKSEIDHYINNGWKRGRKMIFNGE